LPYTTLFRSFTAIADRLDQHTAEVLVERRIGQHADFRLLADLRDGGGLQTLHPAIIRIFEDDGERHRILARADARLDVEERKQPASELGRPVADICQHHLLDRGALRRKPALVLQVVGQYALFDLSAQARCGRGAPATAFSPEILPAIE